MRTTAIIKSSNREVSILIEGKEFWVVHRGGWALAVSGPFLLTDKRFKISSK